MKEGEENEVRSFVVTDAEYDDEHEDETPESADEMKEKKVEVMDQDDAQETPGEKQTKRVSWSASTDTEADQDHTEMQDYADAQMQEYAVAQNWKGKHKGKGKEATSCWSCGQKGHYARDCKGKGKGKEWRYGGRFGAWDDEYGGSFSKSKGKGEWTAVPRLSSLTTVKKETRAQASQGDEVE